MTAVDPGRPDWRFLLAHPAHGLALGLGSGLAPFAPGTFGTLVAIPIAHALRAAGSDPLFVGVIVALFAAGAWASSITGRALGAADHGAIVVDEIVAFLVVLFLVGADPVREAAAFVLFRFFDVVKPPPAREIDARWKTGVGVMLDDLVAAGYTLAVIALAVRAGRAIGIDA